MPEMAATDTERRQVEVSISIRSVLLVAAVVAVARAVVSIADVLLVIFVSLFSVAVLSPVVTGMQRRSGWSRGTCSGVLVLAMLIVVGAGLLVLVQAMTTRCASSATTCRRSWTGPGTAIWARS